MNWRLIKPVCCFVAQFGGSRGLQLQDKNQGHQMYVCMYCMYTFGQQLFRRTAMQLWSSFYNCSFITRQLINCNALYGRQVCSAVRNLGVLKRQQDPHMSIHRIDEALVRLCCRMSDSTPLTFWLERPIWSIKLLQESSIFDVLIGWMDGC